MKRVIVAILFCTGFLACQTVAVAQEDRTIETIQLTDNIYMLTGPGGNVTAFVGEEGTLLVDDKYEQDGPAIQAALESIGGGIPKYLVNTHFHGDHSGSNQHFGERGSVIVGHTLLHDYLAEGFEVGAFNAVSGPAHEHALPELTYSEEMEVHLNGEVTLLVYVPDAHTETDTVVYFTESNLLVTGDVMFNGFFPFIDTSNGGSLAGVIEALTVISELADEGTIIVPGHGPVADRGDVLDTIDTLQTAHDRLSNLKQDGNSLEQTIAAKPLTDIEEDWGGVMFTADRWIEVVWDTL